MTVGNVASDGDALVRLTARGPGGIEREVEAVLDTGFNGSLALPSALIEALGLARRGSAIAILASGEKRRVPTYRAVVLLGQEERPILVAEAAEPLVGMGLLWGYELRIECIEGGRVEIEALPTEE